MTDLSDLQTVLRELEDQHTPDLSTVRDLLDREIGGAQGRRLSRFALPLAAAASVIALAAVSAVVVSGHDGHATKRPGVNSAAAPLPKVTPAPTIDAKMPVATKQSAVRNAPPPPRPGVGDQVTAVGRVLLEGGSWHICQDRVWYQGMPNENELVCGPVSVALQGMTQARLPDPIVEPGGHTVVTFYRVDGTWTGDAIAVQDVVHLPGSDKPGGNNLPSPSGDPDTSTVPCDAPAGGWSWAGQASDKYGIGTAQQVVYDAVAAHSDRYTIAWFATAPGFGGSQDDIMTHAVAVVHTVGSPVQAYQELSAIYPLPICVVPVERSLAELTAIAKHLTGSHPGWVAEPLASSDRVWLHVPVSDAASTAAASDAVVVLPMVVSAG